MSHYSAGQFFIGIVFSTLLSSVIVSAETSHYLLDSKGNPVVSKDVNKCVQTPNTPNEQTQRFERCGDILDIDKDSISDNEDKCPNNTPEELAKGIFKSGEQKGCPIDSDTDKVPDYQDDCPNNTPEELENGVDSKGCPIESDNDTDGILDNEDKCPNNTPEELEKGVDANGCPIDSDQDGVPDYRDSCLNNTKIELAKGVDSTGCPLDSDQDGVPDYLDACPNNSKSDLENEVDASGCVVVTAVIVPEESTYTVQTNSEGALVTFNGDVLFASDSSQLKVDAQTSIEKLIKSLNIDDIQQITVVGHTDHFGSKLYNQKLSEKRAKSVARFLLKKGVSADKVSTEGKGEEQPLSNKKTKSACAENRRVELKITGFKITEE